MRYNWLPMNMLGLAILILSVLFLDCFYALPNALNTEEIFLFFSAMVYENVEYVVIVFWNVFVKVFPVNNYKIILNN